jgi:uncharacterized protein YceK
MKTFWHELSFVHSCGLKGTILEVCVSRDGGVLLSGCCAVCGKEFSTEDTMPNLISKAAMRDYMKQKVTAPEEVLADFVPIGKPN